MPPAPSSTTIKSDVVKSAPISVPPSISKAVNATFPAVDIADNLLSAIDPASIVLLTVPLSPEPTNVPAVAGKVKVISAVEAGPINVTLLVPLSLSSKNSKNPALVEPFFNWAPALIIGVVKVLFVSVSSETKDTKVELAPAGRVSVFVTPALWGCAITICPCELDSQLNCIAPEFVLPLTVTWPVPLGASSKSAFEVVTISEPLNQDYHLIEVCYLLIHLI